MICCTSGPRHDTCGDPNPLRVKSLSDLSGHRLQDVKRGNDEPNDVKARFPVLEDLPIEVLLVSCRFLQAGDIARLEVAVPGFYRNHTLQTVAKIILKLDPLLLKDIDLPEYFTCCERPIRKLARTQRIRLAPVEFYHRLVWESLCPGLQGWQCAWDFRTVEIVFTILKDVPKASYEKAVKMVVGRALRVAREGAAEGGDSSLAPAGFLCVSPTVIRHVIEELADKKNPDGAVLLASRQKRFGPANKSSRKSSS